VDLLPQPLLLGVQAAHPVLQAKPLWVVVVVQLIAHWLPQAVQVAVVLSVVQVPEELAHQAPLVKETVVVLQVLESMIELLVVVVVLAVLVEVTLEAIRVALAARGLSVISPVAHQPMAVVVAAADSLVGQQLQAEAVGLLA
jgi:hypothetical protein